ncbi:hypothetical protein V6R21_22695 [Limibacter armeniacum]|uniref:hypothetical protein n=1 Tax=Limibacter armeniacum TaxID=466084 RepID=UPI002FE53C91
MNLLKELVFLYHLTSTRYIDAFLPKGSKLRMLFDAVLNNQVKDDDEAAKLIYKTSKGDKKYLMLKKNLIKKLTDLLLISKQKNDDGQTYDVIEFECRQELVIADLLLKNNVYHNAERMVWKVIRKAESCHLNEIQLTCYRYLQMIYSLKGDPKATESYFSIIEDLQLLAKQEKTALSYWNIIRSQDKFFISYSDEIQQTCTEYLSVLSPWILQPQQAVFLEHYYLKIKLTAAYHSVDFNMYRSVINELNELYKNNPCLATQKHQLEYYLSSAIVEQLEGKLEIALQILDLCLDLSDYRSFDQFEVQSFRFDVLLKLRLEIEASNILKELKECEQFEMLSPIDKAIWALKEAYLYYSASQSGKLEEIKENFIFFNKGLCINQLHHHCKPIVKNKRGYNTQLQILNVLLKMHEGESDLYNESNNLKMYYIRHLKDSGDERTITFVKFLYKAAQKYEANEGQQFSIQEPMPSGYSPIEVIPYEHLVELINQKKRTLCP